MEAHQTTHRFRTFRRTILIFPLAVCLMASAGCSERKEIHTPAGPIPVERTQAMPVLQQNTQYRQSLPPGEPDYSFHSSGPEQEVQPEVPDPAAIPKPLVD